MPKHREVFQIISLLFAAAFFFSCSQKEEPKHTKFSEPTVSCATSALKNQFIVSWKDGHTSIVKAENRQEFFDKVLLKYENEILFAEHDYKLSISIPEPEPFDFAAATELLSGPTLNWGTEKTLATEVWLLGHTGAEVKIAVIDTGVDLTHPELQNILDTNAGEIPGNEIDDDGNGLIDDVNGWDFIKNSPDVSDPVSHGTHVAGIISASHSSGDIMGMAPDAKIIPLTFLDDKGQGTLGLAIAAIDYAILRGANIINASWGGDGCSLTLEDSINDLEQKNILFVTAAGNEGKNLDTDPIFPAGYLLPAQITVGASTINDFTAAFSNISRTLVALVAPGKDIVSTIPTKQDPDFPDDPTRTVNTESKSGTSMSTPFISGAAALIWGAHPTATAAQVKKALLDSVDVGPFPVSTEGRLNVKKALDLLAKLVAE